MKVDFSDRGFWIGSAYCVLAALAWAIIGPVSRVCFAEGMEPATVAFWRMAVSGFCFLAHALLRGGLHARGRDLASMVLFGAVNVSLVILSLQISIQKSGGAIAIILMFTAPAWVALFSRLLFHEAINASKMTALALAMVGTSLVCLSGGSLGGEVSYLGIACGLLSGFTYAFQFLFFTWYKDRYSTQALFAMTFIPAAFVLSFFAKFEPVSMHAVCALFVLSVVSTYVSYFWYGQSLRYLSPVQAAILGNLEPVVSTLLCWWLWNENFSLIGWVGCALVIGSVLLLAMKRS
ncbi:DMT family transporter [Mailhella sp.]|uniref:DMT family transporter n=1 Tax=Mailhella sp. TaxID=1981029 RepID=UPI003AB4F88B